VNFWHSTTTVLAFPCYLRWNNTCYSIYTGVRGGYLYIYKERERDREHQISYYFCLGLPCYNIYFLIHLSVVQDAGSIVLMMTTLLVGDIQGW